jgi:transcriptional regulator with XRE-family HTH domain
MYRYRRNGVNPLHHAIMATVAVLPAYVGIERVQLPARLPRLRLMTEATLLPEEERRLRIGSIIKRARERVPLTPPQLGDLVGRSRGTVNDWESGRSTPSLADLGPLCAALRVNPEVFVVLPPMPVDPLDAFLLPPEEVLAIADQAIAAGEAQVDSLARKPSPRRSRARKRHVEDPQ